MIRSKQDYLSYLEADRLALGRKRHSPPFFGDEVWKFQRSLRALEFYTNRRSLLGTFIRPFVKYRYHQLSLKCNFSIPPNVFGPGLSIAHRGTIVVNGRAKIGSGCRINASTNIGASGGESDAVPTIGNNVYIGPGAKIFGRIEIADNIAIGANAVVCHSFTDPNITIAGVPAKKISDKGTESLVRQL
jgi:serine O-acetyltransferase